MLRTATAKATAAAAKLEVHALAAAAAAASKHVFKDVERVAMLQREKQIPPPEAEHRLALRAMLPAQQLAAQACADTVLPDACSWCRAQPAPALLLQSKAHLEVEATSAATAAAAGICVQARLTKAIVLLPLLGICSSATAAA